uniref:Uncharacterized protein n=1 Tax=Rhizophora mucronata TaxID=61149 RepID=A0A2P2PM81_RHIMU
MPCKRREKYTRFSYRMRKAEKGEKEKRNVEIANQTSSHYSQPQLQKYHPAQ